MARYDVPRLADYSAAIQANQSFQNAFRNLGQQSQDFLNYEEQKRKNQQDELLNTKKQEHEQTKYNNELQDKENMKIANRTTFQTLYPEEYKSFGAAFGGVPSVENANKMNSVLGSVDLNNFDKNRTFNYNANKDQKDYEYQQNRDKIEDNFKNEELSIRRINAGKPSETERLLSIIMGGGVPKETNPQVENLPQGQNQQSVQNISENKPQAQTDNESLANVTQGIKTESKPISQVDIVTAKNDVKFTDKDGRVWGRNPITKREYLIEDVKPKEISMSDIEDVNKAIEMSNNLNFVKNKYKPSYTGMIDDKINYIKNELGYDSKDLQDYNRWAASLQTVGNAARNKSFGAALSGFDINEFAKEFPSTDAGDGTIIPKLDVRTNMLNNSLKNTYTAWVEKYGKDRANQYFAKLVDKSFIDGNNQNNQQSNYSDEEILKAIKGGK